jgi:hypothetical protein
MELSRAISLVAVVLIIVVAAGYAAADGTSAEAPVNSTVAASK